MDDVNYIFEKTPHLLKCYYWGKMRLLSAFFCGQRSRFDINESQQFSGLLQSHYIYRDGEQQKKINWSHTIVRTGAWARAE